MKSFALIGAAGYVAPRHMKAIRETGNDLVAAIDPSDSVGILDSHFPQARFFTDFELLDAYLHHLKHQGRGIDYVSIATPNHLHAAQAQWAMRAGADVICEKPLVLWPEEIDDLLRVQAETGRRVSSVLQLRLHPAILRLRDRLAAMPPGRKADVSVTYITTRGPWYHSSWKADANKSGGIATNIGVHFFDMLHFLFGAVRENLVHLLQPARAAGYLEYDRARVQWFLSVDANDMPHEPRALNMRTYRSVTVDGRTVEFSDGFADLHTHLYRQVLAGQGFGPEESRVAIETVAAIRHSRISPPGSLAHPMARAA